MSNKIDFDDSLVEEYAKLGLTGNQIADAFGVSRSTISRRKREDDTFDTAFKKGRAKGIAQVSSSLMKQINKGSVRAMMFYLNSRGGWSEKEPPQDIDIPQIILQTTCNCKD